MTYVTVKARTLDDLREYCGVHGSDAVEVALWSAVAKWARKTGNRQWQCRAAAMIGGDASRRIKGWPSELEPLDAHERAVIYDDGNCAMAGWEAAGRPYLRDRIKLAQRYVGFCNNRAPGAVGA